MALLAWAPLLLLSMAEGHAWGDSVRLPFLRDVELHVRLLIALPLLIVAELVVHRRMRPVVGQFLERGLIPDSARATVRRGDRLGAAPAQFVRGGGPPDCVRLRRRGGIHLADARDARRGELVRRVGGWEMAAVAGRLVAGRREPAAVPVPAPALVFPAVHLGALPVAGVAHRVDVRADASGSLRRPGLPRRGELRVRAGVAGPGGRPRRDDGQPDLLRRRHAARIQGGDHRRSWR